MPSEALAPLAPDRIPAANNVVPLEVAGGTEFRPTPEDAVFTAAAPGDAQDLVEAPCRALEVEYKSWRNLDHAEDRAELARDIAALANHGGGFVVFGFQEKTLRPDDTDPFRTNCTSERITAIVRAYLDPPVRCDVIPVLSAAGVLHPVIRVAGHGATPVCVRQDGPAVGGAKLIERGAYYIRQHGLVVAGRHIGIPCPHSGKIEIPQDWAPLIRRCVRRDREALLGMLEATIEGRTATPDLTQLLLTWHAAARAAFLALVPRSPVADSLARRHYALSYGFETIHPETLEPSQLAEALRRTVFELQAQFRSGWNMFDPPYRRAVQARFVFDPATGEAEQDFLETAWLRDRNPGETADFWRVAPRGLATIVRGYAEDMAQSSPPPPTRPRTCLSPRALTREVAELVCHARAFARLFGGVRRVVFRCEWWGLAGRELFDQDARWAHRGPALDDRRVAGLQVSVATLAQAWPEVVAQLIAPVLRAFEPDLVLDADWVRTHIT
ncbi:MAG TPA: RNA-binding domain-containing protein [Acetobacteraceae bacterium]|jgi:hypothetical protein